MLIAESASVSTDVDALDGMLIAESASVSTDVDALDRTLMAESASISSPQARGRYSRSTKA